MNVLLTCAGRRNYLVQYFREAVGADGNVFVTDMNADAPAMHEADRAFVVPAVEAKGYLDNLYSLCQREKVELVVSLNDLELPLLARERERFERGGICLSVSEPRVIDLCFDKWQTFQFLRKYGFSVPKTYISLCNAKTAIANKEIFYPVIVKPRWGTASIGIDIAADEEELELAVSLTRRRVMRSILARASGEDASRCVLIQEVIHGEEYGVDLINDLEGRHHATFVKRKLGMRAGETDKAVTVDSSSISEVGARLSHCLRHYGIVDCDFFCSGGTVTVLEMNPRFGGGYPFSHVAGADVPSALVAWTKGNEAKVEWLTVNAGVAAAKCDRLVLVSDSVNRTRLNRP